jgi:hypothetical protein
MNLDMNAQADGTGIFSSYPSHLLAKQSKPR